MSETLLMANRLLMFVHSAARAPVEGPVGSDLAQRAQVQETLAVGSLVPGPALELSPLLSCGVELLWMSAVMELEGNKKRVSKEKGWHRRQVAEACCLSGNYAPRQIRNFCPFLLHGFCSALTAPNQPGPLRGHEAGGVVACLGAHWYHPLLFQTGKQNTLFCQNKRMGKEEICSVQLVILGKYKVCPKHPVKCVFSTAKSWNFQRLTPRFSIPLLGISTGSGMSVLSFFPCHLPHHSSLWG